MMSGKDSSIYSKHVESLLESIGKEGSLKPYNDPELGIRYLRAEKILDMPPAETVKFLLTLFEDKVLEQKYERNEFVCPDCYSSNLSSSYRCNKCDSENVESKELLHHIDCGSTEESAKFYSNNEKTNCFHCKRELKPNHIKPLGTWYKCKACNEKSTNPSEVHHCRNCEMERGESPARLPSQLMQIELFSYHLGSAVDFKQKYQRYSVLSGVRELMSKYEFKTDLDMIEGTSGAKHKYTIIGKYGERVIGVDIIDSGEKVDMDKITPIAGKARDTKESILLNFGEFDKNADTCAKLFMTVINSDNLDNALEEFEKILQKKSTAK